MIQSRPNRLKSMQKVINLKVKLTTDSIERKIFHTYISHFDKNRRGRIKSKCPTLTKEAYLACTLVACIVLLRIMNKAS